MVPTIAFGLARIKNRLLGRAKQIYSSEKNWRDAPYRFRLDLDREDSGACFAHLSLNGRGFIFSEPQLRRLRQVVDEAIGAAENAQRDGREGTM